MGCVLIRQRPFVRINHSVELSVWRIKCGQLYCLDWWWVHSLIFHQNAAIFGQIFSFWPNIFRAFRNERPNTMNANSLVTLFGINAELHVSQCRCRNKYDVILKSRSMWTWAYLKFWQDCQNTIKLFTHDTPPHHCSSVAVHNNLNFPAINPPRTHPA